MCIEVLESTRNYVSSGFVLDGAGKHTSEGEKNAALTSSPIELENPPLPSPPFRTRFCGRVVLASKSLLESCPQILKHKDYACENECAESHLAMDPFFPEYLCGVMHPLRVARCASVRRIVFPSVKSTWISAAHCPGIRNLFA